MSNPVLNYLTFHEFAEPGRAIMDAACGSADLDLENLTREAEKLSKQPGFLGLIYALATLMYKHLRQDEKAIEKWLERAREYGEWYHAETEREYCISRLSQELYRFSLGLLGSERKPVDEREALLVLNEQLGDSVEQVELVVPIVPTKSPFSLYIVHAINQVMKQVYIHNHSTTGDKRIDLRLHIYWNPDVYPRIVLNTKSHFGFDRSGSLSFDILRVAIEAEFLSFVHRLILRASWDDRKDAAAEKIRRLRTADVSGPFEIEEKSRKLDSLIPDAISSVQWDNRNLYPKLAEGLARYVVEGRLTSLVEDYARDIIRRLLNLEKRRMIIYVAPFQLGLILDHMFSGLADVLNWKALRTVPTRKDWSPREQVRILCYQPFPDDPRVRALLPFYVVPYSYYQYKRQPIPDDKPLGNHLEFVRRLIISSLKNISPDLVPPGLDGAKYLDVVDHVTKLFQGAEREIRAYLKYV